MFYEVSNDITKLKEYDDIERKNQSEAIRSGIDYGFDPPEIEIIFDKPINLRLIK